MTPEGYAENYRRYATYTRDYGDNKLYKIAGGANVDDYRWTDVLMKNIPRHMMNGISLHNYTFTEGWTNKGNATGFNEDDYFKLLENGQRMDDIITRHSIVLDMYDPRKNVGFVVDEWGAWYNVEPGTNPGFLYQQNTLRDALLAGNILNIFHKHADRVRIANLAQMVNVLQSIILTDKEKMILTPTYYVFDMYKVHQDATLLPMTVSCPDYSRLNRKMKAISSTASIDKNGAIHITLVNIDPKNEIEVSCDVRGAKTTKITDGQIITGKEVGTFNTFDSPYQVKLENFKEAKYKNGALTVKVPAKSLVTIELK
jgi:alpha-N-arabinofuranosidase